MSKRKKILEGYIEIQKANTENMTYSMQRLDLLIISLSGAGIYAAMELSKFLVDQKFCNATISDFQIPTLAYMLAIIFNLLSQYTGYKSNDFDFQHCAEKLRAYNRKEGFTDWRRIKKLDAKSNVYNCITHFFNVSSLILLIMGMVITAYLYSEISLNQ